MSVENKLLLKILQTKDWETVMDKGITANYFSGSNKRAFKWISEFKVSYGSIPEMDTFKKHFPEVSLNIDAKEHIGYYCDEVRKKIRHNKLIAVLDSAPDMLDNGNVDECYEKLSRLLLEVNTDYTFAEKIDILNTEQILNYGSNAQKNISEFYLTNKHMYFSN